MSKSERQYGDLMWQRAADFAHIPASQGVNNFGLEGPTDLPTNFHTFLILSNFPQHSGEEAIGVVGHSEDEQYSNARKLYGKVLELEVPERIKKLQISGSDSMAEALKTQFGLRGIPYIALGFGITRDAKQDVVTLFSVFGYTPQEALDRVKEQVRIRQSKFN